MLHRRAFRDSSQIVDILSRNHGRLAVVARGVRARRSRWRGLLEPFRPLSLGWSLRGDLGTLTAAEPVGSAHTLGPRHVLGGFYINELLLNLTHRHDPQPEVYDLYAGAVGALAAGADLATTLRCFELDLLDELGYGLTLDREADNGRVLEPAARYRVEAGRGVQALGAGSQGARGYPGEVLLAVAARRFSEPGALRAARRLTRAALDALLDGRELKTRRVLSDMLKLGVPPGERR